MPRPRVQLLTKRKRPATPGRAASRCVFGGPRPAPVAADHPRAVLCLLCLLRSVRCHAHSRAARTNAIVEPIVQHSSITAGQQLNCVRRQHTVGSLLPTRNQQHPALIE